MRDGTMRRYLTQLHVNHARQGRSEAAENEPKSHGLLDLTGQSSWSKKSASEHRSVAFMMGVSALRK